MQDRQIETSIEEKFTTLEKKFPGTFIDTLGLEFLAISPESITARFEIRPALLQPFGFLHGGVALSVSESLASIGAYLHVDPKTQTIFGQEINANHLKSIQEGVIIAEATAIHIGKRSQVWETKLTDEKKKGLITISRCTVVISERL
jgi:1,4-dihydroxy-2-naphthoyl-CoA hydrolase